MGRRRLDLLFVSSCALFLTSCLNGGGSCTKEFETVVTPDEIKNSKVYISIEKLDFLFDPSGYVIDDIDLQADIQGSNHKVTEDLTLAMNGIKMSRNDGQRTCESMTGHKDTNLSEGHFKLQKFAMNGGLPIDLFLLQLKRQKGKLELALNGKSVVLVNGKVVFKGRHVTCPVDPNPPPSTDPKPVAKTTITGETPSASPTSQTNISISFSADQTGVTFWCSLDNVTAAKCTSPQAYTGLSNGAHVFKVYSQNSSGVKETTPAEYDWTVDSVAPSVTIANQASLPTLTNLSTISFQLTSNEANSTFKCSLDGAAAAACTSPKTYSGLSEGQHTFSAQAVDSVGNVSGTAAVFNWTVDATAPILTMGSVTPYDPISKVDQRTFEFSANETSNFMCSVDNGPAQACSSPVALTGLSEGNHWFQVSATDLAGNAAAPISVAWKNDYTAPVLAFGTIAPAAGLTNAKTISVEFSTNEAGTVYCAQDGGTAAECTSPLSWADVPDGQHALVIYATDLAGNQSDSATMTWTVDSTAPVLSFNSISPSAATYLNSSTVTFDIADSEAGSVVATLNGNAISYSNPLVLSGLADGSYSLALSATDAAGNVSMTLTHDFIIDTVAPTLSLGGDTTNPTNSDKRTFTFASSEDVTYQCDIDSAGYAPCVTPYNLSGLADGQHDLAVQAFDAAGNIGFALTSWVVDTRPPTTTIATTQNGNSVSFSFSADEAATFECSFDGSPAVACTDPMAYANLSSGTHVFTVYATDVAGNRDNAGASSFVTVVNPIHTSIVSYSPSSSLSNSNAAQFTFTADQSASVYLCSLDGAAATPCSSPMNYSGLADGNHSFVVKAVDQLGNPDPTGASHSWTVDTTPPVVNGLSTTATTNSITVSWTTSEGSTDQVLYGVGFTINQQTGESGTYTTTHSIKLVGLSSNTTYSVQVFGRDQAGNSYLSATRTVKTSR